MKIKKEFKKSLALERIKKYDKERHWRRDSMKIAFRILDALEKKGMTQKDLAEEMGRKPQWINRICKGHENMTIGTIREIEAALKIKLVEIVKEQSHQLEKPYLIAAEGSEYHWIQENESQLSTGKHVVLQQAKYIYHELAYFEKTMKKFIREKV